MCIADDDQKDQDEVGEQYADVEENWAEIPFEIVYDMLDEEDLLDETDMSDGGGSSGSSCVISLDLT